MREPLDALDWTVPIEVIRAASIIQQGKLGQLSAESTVVLDRLVKDRRMEKVWAYIRNRERVDHHRLSAFQHPVIRKLQADSPPDIIDQWESMTTEEQQDVAMGVLLLAAFELATKPLRIVKRENCLSGTPAFTGELARERLAGIRKKVRAVRRVTRITAPIKDCDLNDDPFTLGFATLVVGDDVLVLPVDRPTAVRAARKQCIALGLTQVCKDWFGKSLAGVVATIASVALASTVTREQVKEYCG